MRKWTFRLIMALALPVAIVKDIVSRFGESCKDFWISCAADIDGEWRSFVDAWKTGMIETEPAKCSASNPCCERAGEYNGYGTPGPRLFDCPKDCSCHD